MQGKYASTVAGRMQEGLRIIGNWCIENGLSINPQKVALVPFTKRKNIESKLGKISLFNMELAYTNETKHLGLVLDKNLTWNQHLQAQIKKATQALWICRQMVGCSWGTPTPKAAY